VLPESLHNCLSLGCSSTQLEVHLSPIPTLKPEHTFEPLTHLTCHTLPTPASGANPLLVLHTSVPVQVTVTFSEEPLTWKVPSHAPTPPVHVTDTMGTLLDVFNVMSVHAFSPSQITWQGEDEHVFVVA
jgi:hypothetical protein